MAFQQKIFFSIVIPTFNSSTTIKACLNSILSQSFLLFEVWIVDGGSDDDTIEIVKWYASKFTNIHWISEKDQGIYDAMNKGIKLAKGEWVYFLGSDDKLHDKNVLENVHNVCKKDTLVVYGNVNIVGDTTWCKNGDIYDGLFDLQKLKSKNICHQAIFYNKTCFLDSTYRYNTEYKLLADWDLNLKLWAQRPFLYADIIIADFYGGGETTKTNVDYQFYGDLEQNLQNYFGKEIKKSFFKRIYHLFK